MTWGDMDDDEVRAHAHSAAERMDDVTIAAIRRASALVSAEIMEDYDAYAELMREICSLPTVELASTVGSLVAALCSNVGRVAWLSERSAEVEWATQVTQVAAILAAEGR